MLEFKWDFPDEVNQPGDGIASKNNIWNCVPP